MSGVDEIWHKPDVYSTIPSPTIRGKVGISILHRKWGWEPTCREWELLVRHSWEAAIPAQDRSKSYCGPRPVIRRLPVGSVGAPANSRARHSLAGSLNMTWWSRGFRWRFRRSPGWSPQ